MLFNGSRNKLSSNRQSAILLLSFLFVIVFGTILLSLPISQVNHIKLIDLLFTSVSSTCVTGLITISPLNDLTIFGQIVVLIMIQIGGLGLMSFVLLAIKRSRTKLDYNERKFLKDSLNKYDNENINGYLISIFIYTFVTEFVSFLILATQFYDGSAYSLFQSLFIAISAFCNAGIDNVSTMSLLPYQSNVVINLVVTSEVILGGIGFIVWDDIKENIKEWYENKYSFRTFFNKLKIHTRIVLIVNFILIISAMALVFAFEYGNALSGLSLKDKLFGAYFSSVTLRTAGFFTIDFSKLTKASRIIMCVYMLIGGSPGGTAGGFKTTTIFLLVYAVKDVLSNNNNMHIFNRHIHKANYIKASTIIFLYLSFIFVGMIVLCSFENLDSLDLLFEACSAIGTVGLTTGITTSLSAIGKIVIMLLMFIGRIGPITLILSLRNKEDKNGLNIKYPSEEIIVG